MRSAGWGSEDGRGEEGGDVEGAAQIDGKYGSYDRQRMLVKSSGFNFELTLVYSIAAGNHANLESRDVPPPSYGGAILKQHSFV